MTREIRIIINYSSSSFFILIHFEMQNAIVYLCIMLKEMHTTFKFSDRPEGITKSSPRIFS